MLMSNWSVWRRSPDQLWSIRARCFWDVRRQSRIWLSMDAFFSKISGLMATLFLAAFSESRYFEAHPNRTVPYGTGHYQTPNCRSALLEAMDGKVSAHAGLDGIYEPPVEH